MTAFFKKQNVPLIVTLSRVFVTPLLLFLISKEGFLFQVLACILFVLAALTDFLDGKLARKFNAVSNLGKFMDPMADKILVTSVLIMLIPTGKISALLLVILVCRDLVVDGLRAVAASDAIVIAAKPLGKLKATFQMVGIPLLLIDIPLGAFSSIQIGQVIIWLSVILALISGLEYVNSYLQARHKKS